MSAGWKSKAGLPGPWVFLYRYWAWHRKAAQPMPVPASLQPSHHPDHVDPSITDTLSLLVGVETRRHHHHPSHAIALLWKCCGSGLLVLSLNYSDPSPRHQRTITPTSLSHRTHTRTRAQEKRFRSPLRRKASTPHPRMPSSGLAPENLPTSTAT